MSLLSPETLTAYIGPGDVVALHRRGWRQALVGQHIISHAVAEAGAPSDKPAYIGVAATLRKLVAETGAERLQIVLSNHWVHYVAQAWRDDAANDEEQLLLARMRFTEIYGPIADGWQMVMSDAAPGKARLVAAVDGMLLALLSELAAELRIKLSSLQPLLVVVANAAVRQHGRQGKKWLVVHESGRLTLALIDGEAWLWTRTQRAAADWVENLPALLAQEVLLAGQGESAEAVVFSPLVSARVIEARPGQLARLLTVPPLAAEGLAQPDLRFGFPQVFA